MPKITTVKYFQHPALSQALTITRAHNARLTVTHRPEGDDADVCVCVCDVMHAVISRSARSHDRHNARTYVHAHREMMETRLCLHTSILSVFLSFDSRNENYTNEHRLLLVTG